MLLTAVARHAIAGSCPFTIFEASERSSGKTKLADLIGIITAGKPLARSGVSNDNEENRKNMLAIGLAADSIILFDNVKGLFKNQPLEQILTGGVFKDRALGTNTSKEVPVHTLFCMTSNNALLEEDFITRSLLCRLEPADEHPEQRTGFKYEHIEAHTLEHRGAYLTAALTILRAYVVAGRPNVQRCANRYTDWSDVVQAALVWAGGADPMATQEDLRDNASEDKSALEEMLAAWRVLFDDSKVKVRDVTNRITLPGGERLQKPLRTLCDLKDAEALTGERIGKTLKKHRGRIAGGFKLVLSDLKAGGHVKYWTVCKVG
jgi:putative DNA primase/helicase